mgnify:CR=1 FL=1
MSKEQKKNTRSRKYLLTINNPSNHDMSHERIKSELTKYRYRYIALCDETGGEQHTYHSHVYVCFENAILFSTIKKLF